MVEGRHEDTPRKAAARVRLLQSLDKDARHIDETARNAHQDGVAAEKRASHGKDRLNFDVARRPMTDDPQGKRPTPGKPAVVPSAIETVCAELSNNNRLQCSATEPDAKKDDARNLVQFPRVKTFGPGFKDAHDLVGRDGIAGDIGTQLTGGIGEFSRRLHRLNESRGG